MDSEFNPFVQHISRQLDPEFVTEPTLIPFVEGQTELLPMNRESETIPLISGLPPQQPRKNSLSAFSLLVSWFNIFHLIFSR